jgi:CHRD domain
VTNDHWEVQMINRLIAVAASGIAAAAITAGAAAASDDPYDDAHKRRSASHAGLAQGAYMTGDAIADEDGQGDSDGAGAANFLHVDARTVCYGFSVTGTGAPTAIGIYKGAAGETGPLVLPFSNVPKDENGEPAGDPGFSSGCREAENEAEAAALRRIRKAPQNYYLLMKTEDFQGGAIRGQLSKLQYGTAR